jgi:hypothetical protein
MLKDNDKKLLRQCAAAFLCALSKKSKKTVILSTKSLSIDFFDGCTIIISGSVFAASG